MFPRVMWNSNGITLSYQFNRTDYFIMFKCSMYKMNLDKMLTKAGCDFAQIAYITNHTSINPLHGMLDPMTKIGFHVKNHFCNSHQICATEN